MSVLLDEPIKKKSFKVEENDKMKFCLMEMQGWRKHMQDTAIYQLNIDSFNKQNQQGNALFAVFDGHGSFEISQFVKQIFVSQLTKLNQYKEGKYQKALIKSFKKVDEIIQSKSGQKRLKQIRKLRKGEDNLDGYDIAKGSGTAVHVVLITKQSIYVANSGDSRSSLFTNGKTIVFSHDHKPEDKKQLERIQKGGGQLNHGRIGGLNLTRTLGDLRCKEDENKSWSQQIVTACPDVKVVKRSSSDEFILVGCDGVWENFRQKPGKLMNKINKMPSFQQGKYEKCLADLFEELISPDKSSGKFGLDNMTAILIKFKK